MRSLDVTPDGWLDQLLVEVDEHARALRTRADDPADPVAATSRDRAAVATLRLDGSPIEAVPAAIDLTDASRSDIAPGRGRGGGWLDVLRSGARELTTVPDEVLMAVEHRGARAGLDAVDLGPGLAADLPTALAELHRRVTDGLLHPTVVGRARRSEQAVHDASLGRVLFFPVPPPRIAARMDGLATWLAETDVHPVVRSGVLHHQVLDVHPYEAANGRLARIAARLLLAHDDVDPWLLGQPEEALLADAIGYLDEVARSRRLGSPATFVARWAEALADGMLDARRRLDVAPTATVQPATATFLATRGAAPFTVVDHREAVGAGREADAELERARLAGLARRVPGSRGLRWRATAG